MNGVIRASALAACLTTAATSVWSSSASQQDPRVRAFLQAYDALIDSVSYESGDVVFALGQTPIRFSGGRMLASAEAGRVEECDPIFYRYPLGPLTAPPPPPPEQGPRYCTDLLESLWGRSETEIRRHGQRTTFLDHRMFLNDIVIEPLAAVERDILSVAARDRTVADWMEQLDITYSFISRDIAGSPTQSHHAWGMAVDLVPSSYEGKQVYWRWSRVFDREGWHQIPVEERWSPPQAVIEIFERHGFVWGGKWAHFDVIHFEYRPEILNYNRLLTTRGE